MRDEMNLKKKMENELKSVRVSHGKSVTEGGGCCWL